MGPFWQGFEKHAAGAYGPHQLGMIGRLAQTPIGQRAASAGRTARTYGKGMVAGGLLTGGAIAAHSALKGANQPGMVPVPNPPQGYY